MSAAFASASCDRSIERMRSLNSSSVSVTPSVVSGRNCHWLRNNAVSLMYAAMSSMGMPLTTFVPRNGGVKTSLSAATSGERGGSSSRFSRMMSVDFTRRPLIPIASAFTSTAFSIISAIEILIPRLMTS